MDLTPRDIEQKQFHDAWRGYNQEEVDDFLDRVATALDAAQRESIALRGRAQELEQAVAASRDTEEMLKKTLLTAQQAAEEAIAKAKAKAEQLVTEAEERTRSAAEDARQRVAAMEDDVRKRTAEAERQHATRKRELEASVEKLRAFETELKQRLRMFLEQQLRGLDTLTEHARSAPSRATERVRGTASPRAESDDRAPDQQAGRAPGAGAPDEPEDQAAMLEDRAAAPQRRGVRGLFLRDEA